MRFRTSAISKTGDLGDKELKDFLDRLLAQERDVLAEMREASSYKRRVLRVKIDIVRAELVNRKERRREEGEGP